jgi:ribonuclease J
MKIHAIGGYNEVGKNMTVLETGDDAFMFDCGFYLPSIIEMQEQDNPMNEKTLKANGGIPDDSVLKTKNIQSKIRAIMPSHSHLDHIGAIPYLAPNYKCPVLGTPYTIEVSKILMKDNAQSIPNQMIPIKPNGSINVQGASKKYKVEFINMTHSTIQSSCIAVHTPDGIILYANDYKLDNTPIMGEKPNYKRLKQLSKIGIKALIVDCLYAPDDRKTPSEKIARGLLEDVFFTTDNRKHGMIVSTFSSHIARLKSIIEFGNKLGRETIVLGRSLNKYVTAARNIGQAPFYNQIKLFTFRKQLEKALKQVNKNKSKYLIVSTGHQGEPGSILDRLGRNQLPLKLDQDDHVIFSSKTIPSPINEESKGQLVRRLRKQQARIFDNVHVSGHGGREDLRDLIKLTNPEHIIPSHGDLRKTEAGEKLAIEMGYRKNKTVHLMSNGKSLTLT